MKTLTNIRENEKKVWPSPEKNAPGILAKKFLTDI